MKKGWLLLAGALLALTCATGCKSGPATQSNCTCATTMAGACACAHCKGTPGAACDCKK